MNKRSEAAIAKWLKLDVSKRFIASDDEEGMIYLNQLYCDDKDIVVAKFSVASIIKKRLPARKKKGKGKR